MKLNIIDGNGNSQVAIVASQEAVVDKSGTIVSTAAAQVAIPPNVFRSGFYIQNRGSSPMYVNDLGTASTGAGSFVLAPGASFPPSNYPVSTGGISILGTSGDLFVGREW